MTSQLSSKAVRRKKSARAPTRLGALVVMCLLVSAVLAATSASAAPGFRCQRPFSAMDRLADVAKAHSAQNCDFLYFTVQSAAAELQCASSSSAPAAGSGDDDTTCNVTVRWSMQRAPRVAALLQRQVGTDADYFTQDPAAAAAAAAAQRARAAPPTPSPFVTEDEDVWRYAISLKAKGDSTVQYKGFHGGDGYSLCCDALTDATCVWMTAQQGDNDLNCDEEVEESAALRQSRALRSCPLPHPVPRPASSAHGGTATHEEEADMTSFGALPGARVALTDLDEDDDVGGEGGSGVFHGAITKPLHRLVEGPWEVAIQFWRRRQRLPAHPQAGGSHGGAAASRIPTDQSIEAEVLGRLVVPFTLDLAQLRKEGRIAHVPSTALAVEGDVVEVTRSASLASGADEDASADL